MGLYRGSALDGQEVEPRIICNAEQREELGCDADDGLPCPGCEAEQKKEMAYWFGQWRAASPEEKDPAKYRADLIEAGRGHPVRS